MDSAPDSACREIGAAFVAFSPLARGFLADLNLDPKQFAEKDIRLNMPRFQEPHFTENRQRLLGGYQKMAEQVGCTPAQLALAWVLHQGDNIHVIPGTTNPAHLEEDWLAGDLKLSDDVLAELDALINQQKVAGARYAPAVQAQIDTEEF
jgi:aryl-alcohol dehydrogenase-like predicted oxidoreductase